MKKYIMTLLMAVSVFGTVWAADYTIGLQTTSNGLSFHENDGFMEMDLGLDIDFGIYGKKGFGGYINGGYNLQTDGNDAITALNHGVSAGFGIAYKKAISKGTDFLLSTGLGANWSITNEVFNMDYNLGLDFLFTVGSNGYVKLGAGYQLKFMDMRKNKIKDGYVTRTFIDNNVLVPTVGFGVKF